MENTAGTTHSQRLATLSVGEHTYYVLCTDSSDNSRNSSLSFLITGATAEATNSTYLNLTSSELQVTQLMDNLKVGLNLSSAVSNAALSAGEYNSTPLSASASLSGYTLVTFKYYSISAASEITNAINQLQLNFTYAQADITTAGITEANLKPFYYNTSAGAWQTESDYYLNTSDNYILVNVTHMSTFALGTATATAAATTTTTTTGSSGSGGGGGSCMAGYTLTNGICVKDAEEIIPETTTPPADVEIEEEKPIVYKIAEAAQEVNLAGQAIQFNLRENFQAYKQYWIGSLLLLALLPIMLIQIISRRLRRLNPEEREDLNKLEDWVRLVSAAGYSEVEIKELLHQQSDWEEKYINLIFLRQRLIEKLQKERALSAEKLKELKNTIIKGLEKGQNLSRTLSQLLGAGWTDKRLLSLYINSFYEMNKKQIQKVRKEVAPRKQERVDYGIEIPNENSSDLQKKLGLTLIAIIVILGGLTFFLGKNQGITAAAIVSADTLLEIPPFFYGLGIIILSLIIIFIFILFRRKKQPALFHRHLPDTKSRTSLKKWGSKPHLPLEEEIVSLNAEINSIHEETFSPHLKKRILDLNETLPKKKNSPKNLPQILEVPPEKLKLDRELAAVEEQLINLHEQQPQKVKVITNLFDTPGELSYDSPRGKKRIIHEFRRINKLLTKGKSKSDLLIKNRIAHHVHHESKAQKKARRDVLRLSRKMAKKYHHPPSEIEHTEEEIVKLKKELKKEFEI